MYSQKVFLGRFRFWDQNLKNNGTFLIFLFFFSTEEPRNFIFAFSWAIDIDRKEMFYENLNMKKSLSKVEN